ncbi:hypothetical protein K435DRAFT_867505 [Dendrothele bispora CBS 962.96]|uniref:Uncharacterized protein n=1 Tax=Dendrothele bispora (strain CBS 962.96) TaxID=1314807 RepID=A0A4S8LFG1_DENBC|nr:hypothetical protein K435DRAFT_867505 [Dendrothele bispora CBS 962.96]
MPASTPAPNRVATERGNLLMSNLNLQSPLPQNGLQMGFNELLMTPAPRNLGHSLLTAGFSDELQQIGCVSNSSEIERLKKYVEELEIQKKVQEGNLTVLGNAYMALVNAVPALLTVTNPFGLPVPDIASIAGNPNGVNFDIPLKREDYPDVKFWTRKAWKEEEDRQKALSRGKGQRGGTRAAKGINVAQRYIEMDDGTVIDGTRAASIRRLARQMWAQFRSEGKEPTTWEGAIDDIVRRFNRALWTAFPELRLCAENWKLHYLATTLYSGWYRNRNLANIQAGTNDDDDDNDDNRNNHTGASLEIDETGGGTNKDAGGGRKRSIETDAHHQSDSDVTTKKAKVTSFKLVNPLSLTTDIRGDTGTQVDDSQDGPVDKNAMAGGDASDSEQAAGANNSMTVIESANGSTTSPSSTHASTSAYTETRAPQVQGSPEPDAIPENTGTINAPATADTPSNNGLHAKSDSVNNVIEKLVKPSKHSTTARNLCMISFKKKFGKKATTKAFEEHWTSIHDTSEHREWEKASSDAKAAQTAAAAAVRLNLVQLEESVDVNPQTVSRQIERNEYWGSGAWEQGRWVAGRFVE